MIVGQIEAFETVLIETEDGEQLKVERAKAILIEVHDSLHRIWDKGPYWAESQEFMTLASTGCYDLSGLNAFFQDVIKEYFVYCKEIMSWVYKEENAARAHPGTAKRISTEYFAFASN